MSEDVPIKVLLGEFPKESLELFAPELVNLWPAFQDVNTDKGHTVEPVVISAVTGRKDSEKSV